MYPIVKINYSAPAMNTCSRKWIIHQLDPVEVNNETDDVLHFFTLPNTLNKLEIVQLLQCDTATYQMVTEQVEGDKEEKCEDKLAERVEEESRDVGQDEKRVVSST